ncbi:hypothetical protein K443DRAFT_437414 [Laccaria amethystina LaAM-08-1]|uniref:Uncharacterized protein n=1 Tax=Laccaria amethystina LaAM-08-1 TaxID=1095629 RepID=A0A0C9XR11_9AGAR|nr:hypothetical protein K443DRAFT_437414 [Laccaria amethystina LaAM-08-1]
MPIDGGGARSRGVLQHLDSVMQNGCWVVESRILENKVCMELSTYSPPLGDNKATTAKSAGSRIFLQV